MPRRLPPADWQCAVYRYFDTGGQLLYVGSSTDPGARWQEHVDAGAEWTERAVRRIDEWFPTEVAAREAERSAIFHEEPTDNRLRPMPEFIRFDPDELAANPLSFRT